MYHNFLIHSSFSGHIGYFPVLVIVNSAAMNIGAHVFLSVLASSGCMPSRGIAVSYGSFISSFFKGISILFSIVAIPVCTPTNRVKRFSPFSTPYPAFTIYKLFDDGCDWYETISHFGFDLHVSNNE